MNRCLWFSFLLLFQLVGKISQSQTVKSLSIEQGLSNAATTCIYKDHQGFMWFGTYDGLNKYDGTTFTIFRNKVGDSTSIAFNAVSNIAGDFNNNLWLGGTNGACIYHPVTKLFSAPTFIPLGSSIPKKINFFVYWIVIGKNGSVFIATKENGLLVFEAGKEVGKQVAVVGLHNQQQAAYSVNAITYDTVGHGLWLFS